MATERRMVPLFLRVRLAFEQGHCGHYRSLFDSFGLTSEAICMWILFLGNRKRWVSSISRWIRTLCDLIWIERENHVQDEWHPNSVQPRCVSSTLSYFWFPSFCFNDYDRLKRSSRKKNTPCAHVLYNSPFLSLREMWHRWTRVIIWTQPIFIVWFSHLILFFLLKEKKSPVFFTLFLFIPNLTNTGFMRWLNCRRNRQWKLFYRCGSSLFFPLCLLASFLCPVSPSWTKTFLLNRLETFFFTNFPGWPLTFFLLHISGSCSAKKGRLSYQFTFSLSLPFKCKADYFKVWCSTWRSRTPRQITSRKSAQISTCEILGKNRFFIYAPKTESCSLNLLNKCARSPKTTRGSCIIFHYYFFCNP